MEKIGEKIRKERRKLGLTLQLLAKKVDISPMTLHRIEMGKSNPSIVLLSEIANNLNKPLLSFVEEKKSQKLPIHIKRKDQLSISSPKLKLKVIGPRKMITDDIIVTYGEVKKGKLVDVHSNPGKEFTYIFEGSCKFMQNNEIIMMEGGDSIFHNAGIEHSVAALEKLRFISIFIKENE